MSENSYQILFLNLTSGSGAFNDRRLLGRRRTVTVSPRERLPTGRGRQTHAAIDAAARAVVARKGFLATTIVDIAAEAGKSAASFYNDYDSKESMVRESMVNDDDPELTALARDSMLDQFCYCQLTGDGSGETVDDGAVPT